MNNVTSTKIKFRDLKVRCENCSLKNLCLPRCLDIEGLEKLDRIVKTEKIKSKNRAIFKQGESSGSIFAVKSGSIKTFTTAKNGDEQILGFHLPGELLGLDGLDNMIHSCSASTLEPTSICELPITDLNILCVKMPDLQKQLLNLISNVISSDHDMLLMMAKCDSQQKFARFIISLTKRYIDRGIAPDQYKLIMTKTDIGNYLGVSKETISRLIKKFYEQDVISIKNNLISILNKKKLYEIANI
ncbi:MAG: fumarate/nitrate reduction transcriptional regulator Fnr [Gammaproteobacteria bacterium]|jgi:CRP/FNR family transcriptional regulator, anaerobic regulatory protein|nr:fumarate/nitrate reduction transcriptional regulator Fnr [Gammaproteobacteria bacterium]MBT7603863.1 fumarate/nitrate reduction transcriptional regulator Fnr [Gammaproteobacteria bacterium]